MFSWLKLDNAATIYPSITNSKNTNMFRVSIYFHDEVNIDVLSNLLPKLMDRFPYFRVQLRRGFFWYYFEHINSNPKLHKERKYPSISYSFRKDRFLFKIIPYKNRISIETSHVLTDGYGILTFLNALSIEYIKLRYSVEKEINSNYLIGKEIDTEEYEDSFLRFKKATKKTPPKNTKAYTLPFKKFSNKFKYHILRLELPLKDVKKIAKHYEVSINDLLVSVHMYALQEVLINFSKMKYPIRAVVPINLRKYFPTKTLKNFSFILTPEIDNRLGIYSFKEILYTVHYYIKYEGTRKRLLPHLTRNIDSQYKPIVRYMPRIIKDFILKLAYNSIGNKPVTSSISNLGLIQFPKEYEGFIKSYDFIPAPSNALKVNLGVVSFGNNVIINLGKKTSNTYYDRAFIKKLKELNINIRIKTNWR